MRVAEILSEAPVQTISKHEAVTHGMFGPVYHGTTEENRQIIDREGFKIYGQDEDIANRNGFLGKFNTGYPGIPPVHLLGYGIYFTPSKTVGKQYNQSSGKGLVEYYLDVPRLEEIGFTSTNTIWRWWVQNGYDFDMSLMAMKDNPADRYAGNYRLMQEQIRATKNMTSTLAAKFDAVYLKRNAFRRGIDDTQIVVYDPRRIYRIDKKKSAGWVIGSIVTHNQIIHYSPEMIREAGLVVEKQPDGWTHVIRTIFPGENLPRSYRPVLLKIPPPGMKGVIVAKREANQYWTSKSVDQRYWNQAVSVDVKWQKGGVQHNYIEAELDPVTMRD